MMIVIPLLSLLGLSAVAAFCPYHCSCNDVTMTVDCPQQAELDIIPITLNPMIKSLGLAQNRIRYVFSLWLPLVLSILMAMSEPHEHTPLPRSFQINRCFAPVLRPSRVRGFLVEPNRISAGKVLQLAKTPLATPLGQKQDCQLDKSFLCRAGESSTLVS